MKKTAAQIAALLAIACPASAVAQVATAQDKLVSSQQAAGRAVENVIRQAGDGFGTTIGSETIGIYDPYHARGFSPVDAGNVRINGLYYDRVYELNARLRRRTSIRVGPSAQGTAFAAPSGIVDFEFRKPRNERSLSTALSATNYGTATLEADASVPLVGDRLSLGGGVNLIHREYDDGTTRFQQIGGLALNWKPSASLEITPFWSAAEIRNSGLQVGFVPAGEALPPPVPMHHRFIPKWADYSGYAQLYGALASASWKDGWSTDAGLFRASNLTTEEVFVQFESMQPDGSARLKAYANPRHLSASTSGEVRIRKTLTDGNYVSSLLLSLRGRRVQRTYGGSSTLDLGNVDLESSFNITEPRRAFGPLTISSVRQTWLGVAYRGVWSRRGEISASLSSTNYRKNVRAPGAPEVASLSAPLLVNISGSINLHKRLAIYTSYATGLEENGVAPPSAFNRNELLPALETSQVEFGTRLLVGRSVKAIVGVFELTKPYFSADGTGVFRQLGEVQNRGLEASISGPLSDRLNLVLGGNLMDPRGEADAASAGRLGKRPVGIPNMVANGSLEWRTPFVEGLSLDAGLDFRGRTAAKVSNSVFLPSRSLFNLGARYRLKIKGADTSLRLQMSNVFDKNGFDLAGPGAFYPFGGRVLTASIVTDF